MAMAFTCCSPDTDAREQARVSKAIDLELEQWKRDARRELKMLLVGTAIPYTQYMHGSSSLSSVSMYHRYCVFFDLVLCMRQYIAEL